jgi:hypothetical protein
VLVNCQLGDKRGFDLISDALPFGRLWYDRAEHAIGYVKFYSRSHAMIVRVFDQSGALIETHESEGRLASRDEGSLDCRLVPYFPSPYSY